MRLITKLMILTLALSTMQSCVSKKKYDELSASKEASDKALAETQARVAQLETANTDLQSTMESEKERLNGELTSLKSDMSATKTQLSQVQDKLDMSESQLSAIKAEIDQIFGGFEDSGFELQEMDGRLYVQTSTPVRYRSGSARLSKAERDALTALANTMKENPSLRLLVEGHTDTDKMVEGAPYQDNWDLSIARSMGVVRYLISKGVSPDQVAAVGRGEFMPAGDNSSAEGKADNRRTVLLPDGNWGVVVNALKKN
ncbi:MAG: OmpA family protein [Saprospiraceae bacterium]|jgi:chemotaxis protein MotB